MYVTHPTDTTSISSDNGNGLVSRASHMNGLTRQTRSSHLLVKPQQQKQRFTLDPHIADQNEIGIIKIFLKLDSIGDFLILKLIAFLLGVF